MSERIELDEVVLAGVDRVLSNVNTALPGSVKSYDFTDQTAEVDIDIKKKVGGKFVNIPTLVNVPVFFSQGGGFSVSYPLKSGSKVLCIFCQRSIDDWLEDINDNPKQVRKFDLSDAFALPMGHTKKTPIPEADQNNMVIGIAGGQIHINPSGNIFLHSKNALQPYVLGNVLNTFLNAFKVWADTHTHVSAAPGSPTTTGLPVSPSVPGILSSVIKGE